MRTLIRKKCISQESNPGHINGDDVFYHKTTDAAVVGAAAADEYVLALAECLCNADVRYMFAR